MQDEATMTYAVMHLARLEGHIHVHVHAAGVFVYYKALQLLFYSEAKEVMLNK